MSVSFEFGGNVLVDFGERHLTWTERHDSLALEYQAFSQDRLFLADAMPAPPDRRSLTMLWDLWAMRVFLIECAFPTPRRARTAVLERLSQTGSQSAVRVRYRQGGIAGAHPAAFLRTAALTGRHLRYRYSTTHEYDHFYHSDKHYSWFCRTGPDQSLGDFDECDVFELRDQMYLVCWREKLLPRAGIMVENHQTMRSVGKICGADAYSGRPRTRVGAATRLSFAADP